MKFFYPVNRIGDQKIAHFVATVIKYQCAPVEVFAFVRVTVFITGLTGKTCQRKFIAWKVCRYPVEDDADAILMGCIDQVSQFIRTAVP